MPLGYFLLSKVLLSSVNECTCTSTPLINQNSAPLLQSNYRLLHEGLIRDEIRCRFAEFHQEFSQAYFIYLFIARRNSSSNFLNHPFIFVQVPLGYHTFSRQFFCERSNHCSLDCDMLYFCRSYSTIFIYFHETVRNSSFSQCFHKSHTDSNTKHQQYFKNTSRPHSHEAMNN